MGNCFFPIFAGSFCGGHSRKPVAFLHTMQIHVGVPWFNYEIGPMASFPLLSCCKLNDNERDDDGKK